MSGIKKLAGQTMWYGVSSIAARFLNYLLTPYLTAKSIGIEAAYGDMNTVFAFIALMNILFTYGMETAFFRYSNTNDRKTVFNTTSVAIFSSTFFLTILLWAFSSPFINLLKIEANPEFFTLCIIIIFFDTLTTIAFARLRQNGQPRKFALIKVGGILFNILAVYFFLSVCPAIIEKEPHGMVAAFYKPNWFTGYILLANVIQSIIIFLLLSKEIFSFQWKVDKVLLKDMIRYCLPLIIVGFGGMINETFDRILLLHFSSELTETAAKEQVSIYSACYKLSILISLGVQAFKLGAEPFFFQQASQGNAPRTYARVMKFFVITLCFAFLGVALYLDLWKYFIQNEMYWEGLKIVPILLLANMFLGIYYNLSIWYKLSNKTIYGSYITIIGAGITLLINISLIPYFGYMASAWATFLCYGTMMVLSFVWGQKAYPVPYAWKKLIAYMIIVVLLYGIHQLFKLAALGFWPDIIFGTILITVFGWFILLVERKEFLQLPVIGKYLKKHP